MAPLLPEIRQKGIRVVANAGGVNPLACKKALEAAAAKAGVTIAWRWCWATTCCRGARRLCRLLTRDGQRQADPTSTGVDERLPRRDPDRPRAACGCRDRHHRRAASTPPVVLGPLMHEFGWAAATTTTSSAAGCIARADHRVRRAVHRRQFHRLGTGQGRLRRHGLSDRRGARPMASFTSSAQAGRHRRAGVACTRCWNRCSTKSAIRAPTCCRT